MKLSPNQQEIVDANNMYCYVIAGAGSGKTRTLTERIGRLLSESKSGEKVLAITFSNKAANELNDRLLQSYSNEQLQESVYVGTIHSFCMELVLNRGSSIGLSKDLHIFESAKDRLEIFKEALNSVPQLKGNYIKDGKFDSVKLRDLFENFNKAKRDFKFPNDYEDRPNSQLLYQEYNNLMIAQNAIDYDDILLYAYRILTEDESVSKIYQRVYKHICVDEAQDLNRSQYEVIKALAGTTSSIFMVGDPSQAIYGFNGSSSTFMTYNFPKDYKAQKFVLVENYRSSRSIVDAAKKIEPSFEMEGQVAILGECTINGFDNEESEALWVTEKLITLLGHGHADIEGNNVELSQCAVLARNRYVFGNLENVLNNNNIEYHLRASANHGINSESTIFQIFDLSLRLLMNPKDVFHFSELQKILGIDLCLDESFSELRSNSLLASKMGEQASNTLKSAWDVVESLGSMFRFGKVLDCFEEYCDSENNFKEDNERLLTMRDYSIWLERWNAYVKNSSVEQRSLPNMMRSIALGITNTAKEPGLTLSTIHMSKGLEFDVVFIMGLNEGTFPDYRALNDDSKLDEERHNMFVSITRSKRLCYLTYPDEKVMPWGSTKRQEPSRYLTELGLDVD
jgi:DNA helicase-2/ATP-dependent DNA helicase PcrA